MKIIYISFYILFFSKNIFANNLFETNEYEINFKSENIKSVKEIKIKEIKIQSFNNLIKKILTEANLKKINLEDLNLINKFVLNLKINNEKIINNNYYSEVKVNFNHNLIFDHLIKNKIDYVDQAPPKFLIVIMENNELTSYLLSEENSFYKFLLNNKNSIFKKHLIIPNLDYNDRFILNKYHFKNEDYNQNNLLNKKYKSEYQILINSTKNNKLFVNDIYLLYKNKKIYIDQTITKKINYENLFINTLNSSIDKWKEINQISTSLVNIIECKIKINNINELSYVRNLLNANRIISKVDLIKIKLNNNLYKISYFGSIDVFKNSLLRNRLKLTLSNKICDIQIV